MPVSSTRGSQEAARPTLPVATVPGDCSRTPTTPPRSPNGASSHSRDPNASAAVTLTGDNQPMPITAIGVGNTTWTNQWRATVELTPGTHQMTVRAFHPSGQYIASATSWFTNNYSGQAIGYLYNASGWMT